jgi:hypothetical protein
MQHAANLRDKTIISQETNLEPHGRQNRQGGISDLELGVLGGLAKDDLTSLSTDNSSL